MKNELIFCPLGGSGEIGMNMNLYAYGKPGSQKWIIVDVGVTFADDSLPGIDLIYPDPGFIVDKKNDLLGIVLTHAHEDHIGAITYVWKRHTYEIFGYRQIFIRIFKFFFMSNLFKDLKRYKKKISLIDEKFGEITYSQLINFFS